MTRIGRWGTAALGLALMTPACGSSDADDAGEEATPIQRMPTVQNEFTPVELEETIDKLVAEINENATESMQMTVMLKTLSAFFAPIATGANRAMGEIGVTGNVVGPTKEPGDQQRDMKLQSEQIAQAVTDGAEGIGISPFGDANAAAVDDAVANGVHVVTLDTDLAASKRSIYVGTINRSAGETAGKTLLALLPPEPGTVILHGNEDPTWDDGLDRTQGAQGVLEAAGHKVVVRQVDWSDEGADVDWMKDQIETADPPVVGLLGLFNLSFRCAMAAEAAGKQDLPIVAFDFDARTVDYMREGRIEATHIQRQYYEGYLVPYILYGIKSIGLDATRRILAPQMVGDSLFNLGLDVVPGDKVDAYNEFLDSIGANE
ncbi:substrate-binding domain-containing protein (plasmid) [Sorangium sp. So ce119]|uniref:substrate-binding domain-containing protein n=1 Tax=Sorangium sp. So ce119 TaxID=3133279 RepID=UPI003F61FDAD